MAEGEAQLGEFLKAAGLSLGEAQRQLSGPGEGPVAPTKMAISEVEIEVKATIESASARGVTLHPLTSGQARAGEVSPNAVSTLRVRYVAIAEEPAGEDAEPARSPREVIGEVKGREDVASLGRILGGLDFDAAFVPSAGSWLVQVKDRHDRVVREIPVPDSEA